MAAMASKFNFECVIQYYTDQWATSIYVTITPYLCHFHVVFDVASCLLNLSTVVTQLLVDCFDPMLLLPKYFYLRTYLH